jgi:tRNA pseudouridine38-40 synthase
MRFFFEVAYNGSAYNGWQSQHNATGVQTVIEDALSKILRTNLEITGSGRTDTGVHCEQQFFHVDLEREPELPHFLVKLNSFLPRGIVIKSIRKVKPEAHARYDAIERTYHYRITRTKNPFLEGLALHYFKNIDVNLMNEAAKLMIGEHDFESFSKVKTDVNHFICDIKKASWKEENERLEFTISANRFLRGMVRAVVGTLLDVGSGKISVVEFRKILDSRDRKKAGANVPPHGLYLSKVKYPSKIFLNE